MPEEQAQAEPTQVAENSATGNAPGSEATTATPEKSGEKLFTQADLDKLIDDRIKREREKAKAQADKAAKEADERRQAEQGEWKTLAEERKTQLEQLAPKSELADELLEWFNGYVEAQTANWPDSLRAFDPGVDAKFKLRTKWLEEGHKLVVDLKSGTPYPAQHSGTGGNKPATTKEQAQATLDRAYARKDKK